MWMREAFESVPGGLARVRGTKNRVVWGGSRGSHQKAERSGERATAFSVVARVDDWNQMKQDAKDVPGEARDNGGGRKGASSGSWKRWRD